jgi:hypothetical protein
MADAARAGLALELRPALTSSTSEPERPGPPLIVHSHGRGRRLDAGLEESKRVAAMLGVEPMTDPVDLAEVGDCLGASSFVHFAMASPMWLLRESGRRRPMLLTGSTSPTAVRRGALFPYGGCSACPKGHFIPPSRFEPVDLRKHAQGRI